MGTTLRSNMKKLLLFLLITALIPITAWAGTLTSGTGTLTSGTGTLTAVGGCDSGTDYVGTKVSTGSPVGDEGFIYCGVYTPSCSGGDLTTGYVWEEGNNTGAIIHVGFYTDDDTSGAPSNGDTLIAGSTFSYTDNSADSGWRSGAISGTLSGTDDIFICVVVEDGTANVNLKCTDNGTGKLWYQDLSAVAMPATLANGYIYNATDGPMAVYSTLD
jgi:X-X-X-Leu-X-X-Gly heptad repeat protein